VSVSVIPAGYGGKVSMGENLDRVTRVDRHGREVGKRVGQAKKGEGGLVRHGTLITSGGASSPLASPLAVELLCPLHFISQPV
jgi:hypothetical protein